MARSVIKSSQRYDGTLVTDEILEEAAQLFSDNYGVWSPVAESRMGSFAKAGRRVRMSAERLRQQCLPSDCDNTYVRIAVNGRLAGNVFASRWTFEKRRVCWITQLVVGKDFRNCGIAGQLLSDVREDLDRAFGLLSSHPAAIMAALRAFKRPLHTVNLRMMEEWAQDIMASSPVEYVKSARLHGSLFQNDVTDGTVSCADTSFYVDHNEPLEVLSKTKENLVWPFGDLIEGHEFLVLVKAKNSANNRREDSSDF